MLITEDDGLHRRAKRVELNERVLTVADALIWFKQTYEPEEVFLPAVKSVKAYQLDFADPIFEGLRADYGKKDFNTWTQKCSNEHRDCWIIEDGKAIVGLIIRKDEEHKDASTRHIGPKILKICTFKIAEGHRGQKLGEQLLKQALWHAQRNDYNLIYLSAYEKQEPLIRLLEDYGFERTEKNARGEFIFEKPILFGPITVLPDESTIETDHRVYPRFLDGREVNKFVVPINPDYHAKLFPEAASFGEGESVEFDGASRQHDQEGLSLPFAERTAATGRSAIFLCDQGDQRTFAMFDDRSALSKPFKRPGISMRFVV